MLDCFSCFFLFLSLHMNWSRVIIHGFAREAINLCGVCELYRRYKLSASAPKQCDYVASVTRIFSVPHLHAKEHVDSGSYFTLFSRSDMMLVASHSWVYFTRFSASQFCVIAVYMLKYVLCCVLVSLVCNSVSHLNLLCCVLNTFHSWLLFTCETRLSQFLRLHCIWPIIDQYLLSLTPVMILCLCFQGLCYYPMAVLDIALLY